MCGIIGFTGTRRAVPVIVDGLKALEYRGYDSAGIAFFDKNGLRSVKSKGRIEKLKERLGDIYRADGIYCGIGHTRWATHGEPSDRNSHPHGTAKLYIVHNGIIENYAELREFLEEKGYSFESETDTEAAAKLIDFFYDGDPVDAIRKAQQRLRGSYAICTVFGDFKNVIYAFRKDNPLVAAPSEDGNYLVSDMTAVQGCTNRFRRLEEGEIAVASKDEIKILNSNNDMIAFDFETVDWDTTSATMDGYPHFMLKEIHEEPTVIKKTVATMVKDGLPELEISDEKLKSFKKIHIVACGTAMHAGLIGKAAIEALARIPVSVVLASEFRYQNPILAKDDLVIVISQSGETADTLSALRLARERGVFTLGIVNVMGSAMAREADCVLYTMAGPEIAVASTKAYTAQLVVLYLLAVKMAVVCETIDRETAKKYTKELFETVPEKVGLALENRDRCHRIAKKYKWSRNIFFIGRGQDYALSCVAALKMKEISYIHCESCAAGELKHGTISLITDGVPVFAFATDGKLLSKTVSNIKETASRGARVVVFCGEGQVLPKDTAEDVISIPRVSDIFMPVVTATLAQLTAYYMSVELELDVDKPRNLAKSVTVE